MRTIIALALAFILLGCLGNGGTAGTKAPANATGQEQAPEGNVHELDTTAEGGDSEAGAVDEGSVGEDESGGPQSGVDSGEVDTPPDDSGGQDAAGSSGGTQKTEVLLLGRSVAYGWSEYMGLEWQEDESYYGTYDGKDIRYLHMDYPPDIDDSAIRAIQAYDPDIVFFKLCFVDFGSEYGDMLSDDKAYVQNVYQEAVVNRHKKLIIGNALPQVSRDTTSGLKQNHDDYDRWLTEFASTHEGVYVLDLHSMLSDGSGALRSDYASSAEDSHPNRAGYARITPAFMDLVEQAQGG